MTEYIVHLQKGSRIGARSLHMHHVEAESSAAALRDAKRLYADEIKRGYRVIRIDHFDEAGRLVRD